MAHKGHPDCPYRSRAACEKARREAIGPCIAMLDEDRQCPHLGTDTVDGRAYCGQHIGTPYREAAERELKRRRVDALNQRIDTYLYTTNQQPHVCGDHCEFSSIPYASKRHVYIPQPRPEEIHWTSEALGIDTVTGATVRETEDGFEEVFG